MDEFGLELILAEESAQTVQQQADPPDPDSQPRYSEQTLVIERTDFTASSAFVIGDQTRMFPIYGVGRVESLLLITESTDYRLTVEMDTPREMVGQSESAFIDGETYDDLNAISTELESVAAYENDDGNNVLDVGEVDFIDNVRAFVEPTSGSLSVLRQRAEVTVEQAVE